MESRLLNGRARHGHQAAICAVYPARATAHLARETEVGRRLYSDFCTAIRGGAPVRRLDEVNTAKVSVLDHQGDLLAPWEAGSASIVDRAILACQGFKDWGESLEGLPFTPHLRVQPDGTLWAFGVNLISHRAVVKAQALCNPMSEAGLRDRAQRVDRCYDAVRNVRPWCAIPCFVLCFRAWCRSSLPRCRRHRPRSRHGCFENSST